MSRSPWRRPFRSVALAASLGMLCGCVRQEPAPLPNTARTAAPSSLHSSAASASGQLPPPPPVPIRDLQLASLSLRRLSNGMELWHFGDSSIPLVHLRVVVDAGSADDAARPGLSALTAMSLALGAQASFGEGKPLSPLTDRLQVAVHHEATIFSLDILERDAPEAVALLGAMMGKPAFRLIDGEAARKRIALPAPARPQADFMRAVRLEAGRAAEAESTPAPTVGADPAKEITPLDVQGFYRTAYGARRTRLIVVGKLELDDAVRIADGSFGGWTGAPARLLAPTEHARATTQVLLFDAPDRQQPTAAAVIPTLPVDDAAWPAIWLAAILLRSKLPAACEVAWEPGALPLLWVGRPAGLALCTEASPDELAKSLEALLEGARRLASAPPADADMLTARKALLDQVAVRTSSPSAVADLLSSVARTGASPALLLDLGARLRAVTAAEVSAAARTHLAPERWTLAVVGPRSLAAPLGQLGDVRVLSLPGPSNLSSPVR